MKKLIYLIPAIALAGYKVPTDYKISQVSRADILNYAHTGVGSRYVWGGTKWSPKDKKKWGADCSGFVQKAWQFPQKTAAETALAGSYTIDGKKLPGRITTEGFNNPQAVNYPWTKLKTTDFQSYALPADALVRRKKDSGHILLVSKLENTGIVSLEARGVKYGIGYSKRTYVSLKNSQYHLLKRKNLK